MITKIIEWFDDDVYCNGELVGNLQHSVGPCGTSSGDFRFCKTTTPINEICGGGNILLVNRWDIPIPKYL